MYNDYGSIICLYTSNKGFSRHTGIIQFFVVIATLIFSYMVFIVVITTDISLYVVVGSLRVS